MEVDGTPRVPAKTGVEEGMRRRSWLVKLVRVMDFYLLLWGGSSWLHTGTLVRHLEDPGLPVYAARYMPFDHLGWRWNFEATP